jgi:putative ABC transport system permease protein
MAREFILFALAYGLRSLGRNPTRSLLTIATIGLSVGVSIVVMRYSAAVITVLQEGAWDTGLAHLQAHSAAFKTKEEGLAPEYLMSEANPFELAVLKDPRIEATSRRIRYEGLITFESRQIYFIGIGVEPGHELAVSKRLFTDAEEGKFVQEGNIGSIAVGRGLAQTLNLKLQDEVALLAQTLDTSSNGMDATVFGILDIPLPSFSKRSVYTHLGFAQELLQLGKRYSELAIRLKRPQDIESFYKDYAKIATDNGIELRMWFQIEPMIKTIEKIWNGMVGVISTLLFLSAAISVANMVLMLVNERTIEIGTLMAVGARPGAVRVLFALEGSMFGVIGGLIGGTIGNIAVAIMSKTGVPFDNPFGASQVIVYPQIHVGQSVAIFAVGILICFITSSIPAEKAARVEPVRAFRGQLT